MLLLAGMPLPAADTTPPAAADETYHQRYARAMQAGLYAEAADASATFITVLLEDPDFDRREWAEALVRLGRAQYEDGDYSAAIGNFELAVDSYQEGGDRLDPALIAPLSGLADGLIAAGEFRRAVDTLERVVHLEHVNNGLTSMAQCKSLQQLSDLYLMLGRPKRALAHQQAITQVYHQNFPGDDVRKLPALYAEAELLRKLDMLVDSHMTYRRTIAMIERADGTRSPHLLPAFYRLSQLLVRNSIMDGYDGALLARRYLRRAVHIADHNDLITPVDRADAHIAMGDFLTAYTGDRGAAQRRYRKAWSILSADPALERALVERFASPTLLNELPSHTAPIMRNLLAQLEYREPLPDARVLVRFDVDIDGRPQDIEVVEGDPSGYWDELVVDHVGKFVFRPQLDDGLAVRFEDMHWNIPFLVGNEALRR